MAHNGKVSLSDYDMTNLHDFEIDKIKKAVAKRQRRDIREQCAKLDKSFEGKRRSARID